MANTTRTRQRKISRYRQVSSFSGNDGEHLLRQVRRIGKEVSRRSGAIQHGFNTLNTLVVLDVSRP